MTEFHRHGRAPVWQSIFSNWSTLVASGEKRIPPLHPIPIPAFSPVEVEKQETVQQHAHIMPVSQKLPDKGRVPDGQHVVSVTDQVESIEAKRRSYLGNSSIWRILKETFDDWVDDRAPRLGAALAYYAVFSLAPILILALAVAGLFFDSRVIEAQLNAQFEHFLGSEGAEAVATLVAGARKPTEGAVATVIGIVALVFGATGFFIQLKDAMNTIWEAEIKPGQGAWGFVRKYILSFAMVLGIGFLLIVLLFASVVSAALTEWLAERIHFGAIFVHLTQLVGSVLVVALLMALIFKWLPDVRIAWRDVWLGAFVTSLLFNLGQFAIGMYLGRASFGSSYGAAGTVLIVLAWTYYSAQILFLGAEFTQVYARNFGTRIQSAETAKLVDDR